MRFFIDTNILISAALFPAGKAALVFSHILESHELILSDYTIRECQQVFARKFPEKSNVLNEFFQKIHFTLYQVPESIDANDFPKIRDAKDLPVLAAAILSDADILLTGDKDFCDIAIERPVIFSPARYWDLIGT